MQTMYLMAPSVYHTNCKYDTFCEIGGETYANHIIITMGEFLSELCKKEILDCLDIPEERRTNGLDDECLRVLSKHHVCFTHNMITGSTKIN